MGTFPYEGNKGKKQGNHNPITPTHGLRWCRRNRTPAGLGIGRGCRCHYCLRTGVGDAVIIRIEIVIATFAVNEVQYDFVAHDLGAGSCCAVVGEVILMVSRIIQRFAIGIVAGRARGGPVVQCDDTVGCARYACHRKGEHSVVEMHGLIGW